MKIQRFLAFCIFLVTIISSISVQAQINYNDIRVDDLTDAQILTYMQRAEALGYTDAQLEQLALAQGFKTSEIQKLKIRVEKIRMQSGGNVAKMPGRSTAVTNSRARSYSLDGDSTSRFSLRDLEDEKSRDELLHEELFESIKPKIFGSELFKNRKITFEPNLRMATPAGYIIGPDDELLIDLTGDNEKEYKLIVSPDGKIRMEFVGLISVGGLTIDQARSKVTQAMTSIYPALRTGRSQVAVNLGNIRSIRIIISGAATKPGTYTLPSLATVFNALYAAGGPNPNGSYRNIQVVRNNKVVGKIDVYEFLLKGVQSGNIRLQDQDVIHIPVFEDRVELTGEVKNPAHYEVIGNESLESLLRYAGGFNTGAYSGRIKVLQNTPTERKITDIANADFDTYRPKNGDKFIVEALLDRFENRVRIQGAVFRPGEYQLDENLTLKGLIQKADGLKEDAFLNRGYIHRLNVDNSLTMVSFDLKQIMAGQSPDIALQREDQIIISSIFELREEYKVNIQGEVRQPGMFDYARNMQLQDLIQKAGGFKEGATPKRIEIARRVKNADANSSSAKTAEIFVVNINKNLSLEGEPFLLEPFDIVSVRSSEGYSVQKQVKIEGEVLYPGTYTINRKDERISDIIKRAGGLTNGAYPEGASLKRPGPSMERAELDDKIAIEKREERQRSLLNLERVKVENRNNNTPIDTNSLALEQQLSQSDLVGINLERILGKPGESFDLFLEDGDVIRVPKLLQTVKVTGEVLNPNGIIYRKGMYLKDYVNGAGGFTPNAQKRSVYVKYANGTADGAKKFLIFNSYPKIKPGAEIMVPKRAPREPMTTQAWISISTALASMAAIIITLFR